MQVPNSFKLALLKQMLLGFQLSAVSSNGMSFHERKNAIKLSADAAMVFARGSTRWTRGLVASLSKNRNNDGLLRGILGKKYERLSLPCCNSWKIPRSRKILKRCLGLCSRRKKATGTQHDAESSITLARRLAKKRIQVLKKLLPGGESMEGFSLLDQTLDYAVSLKAQVDIMRRLLKISKASNLKFVDVEAQIPQPEEMFLDMQHELKNVLMKKET